MTHTEHLIRENQHWLIWFGGNESYANQIKRLNLHTEGFKDERQTRRGLCQNTYNTQLYWKVNIGNCF